MKRLAFKDVIIRKRAEKGWTLTELAERSGVSEPSLSRIEGGTQQNLTDKLKLKLCQALNISIIVPLDAIEEKMCHYIPELSREDKLTILRFILRLRNSAIETETLMKDFLQSLSDKDSA